MTGPELARRWDALAESYDRLGVEDPATYWRHTATNLVLTRAELEPGDVVLDLGTGTGNVARTLAPHVRRTVGLDISPAMLRRARALPGGEQVEWMEGDLRSPPKLPGLQVITANYAFSGLSGAERLSLFQWAFSALPKGGMLVFGDLFWNLDPDEVEGVEGWFEGEVAPARTLMVELEEKVGFTTLHVPLHPVVSVFAAVR